MLCLSSSRLEYAATHTATHTLRPTSLMEQFDVGDAGAVVDAPATRADENTSVVVSGGSSVRESSLASDAGLNAGDIEGCVDDTATTSSVVLAEESSSLLRGAQSGGTAVSRASMLVGLGVSARAITGLRRGGAGPVGLQQASGVITDDAGSSGSP